MGFQIQGISLQLGANDDIWTGRARLQHRILGVYLQSPKASIPFEAQTPKQQ